MLLTRLFSPAPQYRLETFAESRQTEPAEKPFEGEEADFYTQPAPRPWEVPATAPALFTKHKEEIRVPYTSSIKVTGSQRGVRQKNNALLLWLPAVESTF
ncbi:hypothetical protein EYF80_044662 [Liparis tanakae]|uniref:Uncharacterized protein n=1 Tax=Liparis tanakae TaxID=230148 RepID=A0A4Z2FWF2_9TELE|nr:hypothetical protein EYF80_044662 [Liparis tanakae]